MPVIDSLPYTPFVNITWVNSLEDLKEALQFQVHPNPTDSVVQLSFSLEAPGRVSVTWLDLNGRTLRETDQGVLPAGPQAIEDDLSDLPAGTYVYQLHVNDQLISGQVIRQ